MIDGEEHAVGMRAWLDILYRARLDKTTTQVGEAMALTADSDGTHIFPGAALISFRTKLSYKTVQDRIAYLQKIGLLLLIKSGAGRHRSDGTGRKASEYRLVQNPFLLDAARVVILSPSEAKDEVDRIRKENEGKFRPKVHPAAGGALVAAVEVMHPVAEGALTVNDAALGEMHPVSSGAFNGAQPVNAPPGDGALTGNAPPLILQKLEMHPVPGGATEVLIPTTKNYRPNPTPVDPRTDLKVVRAGDSEDPEIEVLPVRCPHKIRAQRRPDGSSSCALCRVGSKLAAEGSPLTTPTGTFRIVPRGATA